MKIVIATGGTGGHIFPAAQVAKCLQDKDHEVLILGVIRKYKNYLIKNNLTFKEHQATGVFGSATVKFFESIKNMIRATKDCYCQLKDDRPDVVVGFGGYGAFPVVISAVILKIPTLIHEQNVVPGKANLLLGLFVNKIAISFERTKLHWKNMKQVLTGCPSHVKMIKRERGEIYNDFGLDSSKKTILVLGGSQGSQRINDVVLQTVSILKYTEHLQIIHVAGFSNNKQLEESYIQSPIMVKVYDFLTNIDEAMCIADIVVSRAGALTVMEIAGYNKSAVLIPYPHAGGHQMENARVLQESGHARIIEDKHLTSLYLSQIIEEILEAGTDHSDSEEHHIFINNAVEKISELTLQLGDSQQSNSEQG